jgi:hypothetical protein
MIRVIRWEADPKNVTQNVRCRLASSVHTPFIQACDFSPCACHDSHPYPSVNTSQSVIRKLTTVTSLLNSEAASALCERGTNETWRSGPLFGRNGEGSEAAMKDGDRLNGERN